MGPVDFLLHLMSLLAPAAAVALLVALAARVLRPKTPGNRLLRTTVALNFGVGSTVLLAGLWWFGRDGRMLTYAALVLACATSQWIVTRALK